MTLRLILACIIFVSLPLTAVQAMEEMSTGFTAQASPGTRIWYMQGNELWSMNLDGSNQVRVASDIRRGSAGCMTYYVSPDGRNVAFQLNDGQFVIANSDGSNSEYIAAGRIGSASWSTNGQNIIYSLNDDIYLYNVSSRNAESIATGGGRFSFPAFAPDNQNFAFLEAPGGNIFNVIIVRTSSREWRSLGTTAFSSAGTEELCPDIVNWSPDSTKLLIDYGQPVFVFYLAGGTPTQVGGQSNTASHFWSPSGDLLAFKETDGSLWLVNPDGSGQRPLVAEPVRYLAWNPTGAPVIAYTTQTDGVGDLWIVNIQNGQKQQLTGGDTSRESNPVWFSDGRTIAFERRGLQGEDQGIWRVSVDGSGLNQLIATGSDLQLP